MRSITKIRGLVTGLLGGALVAGSAATAQIALTGQPKPSAAIPATLPTEVPTAPAVPLTPSQRPPHHATVTWEGGQLAIDADNSSLNQILREVSRLTGMKITGGVLDERVFGVYGPGDPSAILNALLDGTGSNLLLVLNDAAAPAELILTPRHGGASPPSPNAMAHDDDRDAQDLPPQQIRPFRRPEPQAAAGLNAPVSSPVVPAAVNVQPEVAPAIPVAPALPTAAADTTTQQSPNGVKTPQQIYEQLLKMQQKATTPQ